MAKTDLTAEYLREIFDYNPQTGDLHWRIRPAHRVQIGDKAGYSTNNDHVRVTVLSSLYLAHRLIWVYVYGDWPKQQIDHINGVRTDNRISNLREASPSENSENLHKCRSHNQCGFLGVYERYGRWQARIRTNGITKSLGVFDTAELAHEAYLVAKREDHIFGTI
jgi:hypothetical protein